MHEQRTIVEPENLAVCRVVDGRTGRDLREEVNSWGLSRRRRKDWT